MMPLWAVLGMAMIAAGFAVIGFASWSTAQYDIEDLNNIVAGMCFGISAVTSVATIHFMSV